MQEVRGNVGPLSPSRDASVEMFSCDLLHLTCWSITLVSSAVTTITKYLFYNIMSASSLLVLVDFGVYFLELASLPTVFGFIDADVLARLVPTTQ